MPCKSISTVLGKKCVPLVYPTEHGHKVTFRNDIMSVLGLSSGYAAKYGLNHREFPRAAPSGTPLGSGHISPYIPRLVLIRIQY